MPSRSLVTAAVIVFLAAVLVGVFLGLPTLLMVMGVDINAGLIVNALAAIGALSAAVAAVWIATSDRRQREQERRDTDEAQARLVIIEPLRLAGEWRRGVASAELAVLVKNFATLSVLDVTVVDFVIGEHPHLRPSLQPPTWPVVEPNRYHPDGALFSFTPPQWSEDEEDEKGLEPFKKAFEGWRVRDYRSHAWLVPTEPTITVDTILTATVRFRDAKGNRWETTFASSAQPKELSDRSIGSTTHLSLKRVLDP
jgi:hypothetical protein